MMSAYTIALRGRTAYSPGFTLLELLFCLLIVSILSLISTGLFALADTARANQASSQILHTVHLARSIAISHGRPAVLCPSADGIQCAATWQQQALLFLDSNRNGSRDDDEPIRHILKIETGKINWRAFGGRAALTFNQDGSTAHQNGRFYYCPSSGEKKNWRQWILHKSGRARLASPAEMKNCLG